MEGYEGKGRKFGRNGGQRQEWSKKEQEMMVEGNKGKGRKLDRNNRSGGSKWRREGRF